MSSYHIPIMLNEVMELLKPNRGGLFVDGTLGGGGHSLEIYKAMPKGSRLFCIDRDMEAIVEASRKFSTVLEEGKEFCTIHGNFFEMKELLSKISVIKVDGILLDLGVSSHQLDEPKRGFSYMQNAPLDMRMDTSAEFSAYDVVNTYEEQRLKEIISNYGEERYAGRIAKAIAAARESKPIGTTSELVEIIKAAMPKQALHENQHPAKRTFQAIRIEVNSELNGLEEALNSAIDLLNPGGVIAVITFHSLEDRIVKQTFAKLQNPCTCDPKAPICTCNKKPVVKVLTKKPVVATRGEIICNPRARSAKLRGAEKI